MGCSRRYNNIYEKIHENPGKSLKNSRYYENSKTFLEKAFAFDEFWSDNFCSVVTLTIFSFLNNLSSKILHANVDISVLFCKVFSCSLLISLISLN